MATLKYSRQRESIKEFLMTRKDHPTADVVYENVKKYTPTSVWEPYIATFPCYPILEKSRNYPVLAAPIILTAASPRIAISCVPSASGFWIWKQRT